MKKLLWRVAAGLFLLLVVLFIVAGLFLDAAVKRGVEVVGPKLTRTTVTLDSLSLSLLSGSGTIKGFVVGNPQGFHSPDAIRIGKAHIALKPASLLSHKVIIKSLVLESPEVTLEQTLEGNNLKTLRSNIDDATRRNEPGKPSGGETRSEAKAAGRALEVDELVITGGKVNMDLFGRTLSAPLHEIHLTSLGASPEGITVSDLSKTIFNEIIRSATDAAASAPSAIDKGARTIENLFKKK
jgi:hypothetical protein